VILDIQCAVEAGKEFPNLVVGKEGRDSSSLVSEAHSQSPANDTAITLELKRREGSAWVNYHI